MAFLVVCARTISDGKLVQSVHLEMPPFKAEERGRTFQRWLDKWGEHLGVSSPFAFELLFIQRASNAVSTAYTVMAKVQPCLLIDAGKVDGRAHGAKVVTHPSPDCFVGGLCRSCRSRAPYVSTYGRQGWSGGSAAVRLASTNPRNAHCQVGPVWSVSRRGGTTSWPVHSGQELECISKRLG